MNISTETMQIELDVKDKMEHVRAFFNYYPDDENRKEEIRIVKNS